LPRQVEGLVRDKRVAFDPARCETFADFWELVLARKQRDVTAGS
jgi:hypothetical protein